MFVGNLLRDPARDFGVEFESLRHREIFEISARGQKTIGSHLKGATRFSFVSRVRREEKLVRSPVTPRRENPCLHLSSSTRKKKTREMPRGRKG